MSQQADVEKDYETYKLLLELWTNENPIKTSKLQVLLVVNGLLVSAVQMLGGFVARNWPIYLVACLLSLVWTFSIGRTVLFQQVWKLKIQNLADKHPEDSRFEVLAKTVDPRRLPFWVRLTGSLSSKLYLIGAPILFACAWLVALTCSLLAS